MKLFPLLIPALLVLVGCATTPTVPKTELSLAEYQQYGKAYSLLDTCLRRGHIDSETHGKGWSLYNGGLAATGKIVNSERLDRTVSDVNRYTDELQSKMDREMSAQDLDKDKELVKFTCQKLSGELQIRYSETQEANRQRQRQNEINQQRQNQIYAPVYNKSSTTYCNQFGSQVICNSY